MYFRKGSEPSAKVHAISSLRHLDMDDSCARWTWSKEKTAPWPALRLTLPWQLSPGHLPLLRTTPTCSRCAALQAAPTGTRCSCLWCECPPSTAIANGDLLISCQGNDQMAQATVVNVGMATTLACRVTSTVLGTSLTSGDSSHASCMIGTKLHLDTVVIADLETTTHVRITVLTAAV